MALTSARRPSRTLSLALALLAATIAFPAAAQSPHSPPVFDELASPFTESETGGLGCLAATLAAGAGMIALMGGPGAAVSALGGIVTPRGVLEASAANAFVFSSACYVGQAMAPLAMLGYATLLDTLSPPAPVQPSPAGGPSTGSGPR